VSAHASDAASMHPAAGTLRASSLRTAGRRPDRPARVRKSRGDCASSVWSAWPGPWIQKHAARPALSGRRPAPHIRASSSTMLRWMRHTAAISGTMVRKPNGPDGTASAADAEAALNAAFLITARHCRAGPSAGVFRHNALSHRSAMTALTD